MASKLMITALALLFAHQAAALSSKSLRGLSSALHHLPVGEGEPGTLAGTDVQQTDEWARYRGGSDVGGSVLMNLMQAQVSSGNSNPKIFTVTESRKAGQMSSATRNSIGSNDAHGTVEQAAGGSANAYQAAKEAQSLMLVTQYGRGMALASDLRASEAGTDAQREIQMHLDNPFAAASAGANTAWAASFPKSHQWTNRRLAL